MLAAAACHNVNYQLDQLEYRSYSYHSAGYIKYTAFQLPEGTYSWVRLGNILRLGIAVKPISLQARVDTVSSSSCVTQEQPMLHRAGIMADEARELASIRRMARSSNITWDGEQPESDPKRLLLDILCLYIVLSN